jgi:hypothetical protein
LKFDELDMRPYLPNLVLSVVTNGNNTRDFSDG